MAVSTGFKPVYPLPLGSTILPGYLALYALLFNLLVAAMLTYIFNAARIGRAADLTAAADYV